MLTILDLFRNGVALKINAVRIWLQFTVQHQNTTNRRKRFSNMENNRKCFLSQIKSPLFEGFLKEVLEKKDRHSACPSQE